MSATSINATPLPSGVAEQIGRKCMEDEKPGSSSLKDYCTCVERKTQERISFEEYESMIATPDRNVKRDEPFAALIIECAVESVPHTSK
jgi:hypothetical protein